MAGSTVYLTNSQIPSSSYQGQTVFLPNSAGQTYLDRPLRVATWGPSIANTGSSVTDVETPIVAMPGSGGASYAIQYGKCPAAQFMPMVVVANGGIDGQTVAQMFDRSKAAYSSARKAIQDVLRKRPDVVVMIGGPINDYAGMTSSTPIADVDTRVAAHAKIVKYFTDAGVTVFDYGCIGYSVAGVNMAAIRTILLYSNTSMKSLSATDPKWVFIDPIGITCDASGAFLPGMSDDNLHQNYFGGYSLGISLYAELSSRYQCSQDGEIIWSQIKDFANASGGAPANQATNASTGFTVSSRTVVDDVFSVTVNVTDYTTANVTQQLTDPELSAFLEIAAGDSLLLESWIRVFDSNGNEVLGTKTGDSYFLRIHSSDNSANVSFQKALSANTGLPWNFQFYSPVAAANMGTSTLFYFGTRLPANGVYTIKFYPLTLRRHNVFNLLAAV